MKNYEIDVPPEMGQKEEETCQLCGLPSEIKYSWLINNERVIRYQCPSCHLQQTYYPERGHNFSE